MKTDPFYEVVRKHFDYLVGDYDFVTQAIETGSSHSRLQVYTTMDCRVGVRQDGSQVFVEIGPAVPSESNGEPFDLYEILRLRNPRQEFLYKFDPDGYALDPRVWLDDELSRLAALLRAYCPDMLAGDFSAAGELQQSMRKQYAAVFARMDDVVVE